MKLNSLVFLVQEAAQNIRRNGLMTLAALGTVTVAMTVLGGSLWIAFRIHEWIEVQPQKFNEVMVFLNHETPREKTLAMQQELEKWVAVRRVTLITKEEAWADLRANETTLTQALPSNPLPDAFRLEAREVAQIPQVARVLRDPTQFPDVVKVTDAGQEVRIMLGVGRLVRVVGGTAAAGLFIATLFIVQNTIRLTVFARRREIRIMQLVGATGRFIRLPLLLEGLFHGVIGALFASGIVLVCAREVARFVAELRSPLIGEVPSALTYAHLVGGMVAIGAFIGLVGSHLAMRRFLKQI